MQAEIISVANEILLGHIVNTNATHISQRLRELGIEVCYHISVGDNPKRLSSVLKEALGRSDIVITTGGLGPTVDDITIETISKVIKKKLIFKKKIYKKIMDHFDHRKIEMPPINRRQAYIPGGSKDLANPVGTAPGVIIEINGKVLIALPGVPAEMMPMMADVINYLRDRYPSKATIESRIIKVVGLPESATCEKVQDLLKTEGDVTVGIYPHTAYVDLKINAKAEGKRAAGRKIAPIEKKIRSRLGNFVFGTNDETLEGVVGELLTTAKLTICVAESCTGGLIADRLTNVAGSSKYFTMAYVAYSNRAKVSQLGVSKKTIERYGAVSSQVAVAMARGIKRIAKSDLALGVTGIAGPTGATKTKPIGLVYITLSTPRDETWRRFNFIGDRLAIKLKTSQAALDMVRWYLIERCQKKR